MFSGNSILQNRPQLRWTLSSKKLKLKSMADYRETYKETVRTVTEKALFGLMGVRSAVYFTEALSLPYIDSLIRFGHLKVENPTDELKTKVFSQMRKLLEDDARHIADGLYPARVLLPENPIKHFPRLAKIYSDTVRLSWRKRSQKHKEFSTEAEQFLDDVPDYYRRNFHYQTDGYLSEQSAEMYEHQVEMLFRGLADPMRRLLLPPMKRHFKMSSGRGLHFLEVAAGVGSLTRQIAMTFPEAKITVLDLSYPYIKKAQQRLKDFSRIEFVQGDAAQTMFKEHQFDAVVSSFVFHELPREERLKVLKECKRLTKPGGFIGHVDSVQEGDQPGFEWAMDKFPQEFHEPFYKNYVQTPMRELWTDSVGILPHEQVGFYSKVIWSKCPKESSI